MIIANLSVSELAQTLEGSSCKVSFWGERLVYLQHGTTVRLNDIADRLAALGFDCIEKNYSIEDRVKGHQVKKKLIELYEDSYEQTSANIIILLFKRLFGLDHDDSFYFPEQLGPELLTRYDRMVTFELFQAFKTNSDYMKLALFRPLSSFGDSVRISTDIQIDGVSKRVHYYCLKEIGQFCLF